MVEAYRKAKIEKLMRKLLSRKEQLKAELELYKEGDYLFGVVTGQIVELNYTIGDIRTEFKLWEESE